MPSGLLGGEAGPGVAMTATFSQIGGLVSVASAQTMAAEVLLDLGGAKRLAGPVDSLNIRLALPLPRGMDAVHITQAHLGLRVPALLAESNGWKVRPMLQGQLVDLGAPSVLARLELTALALEDLTDQKRLLLRPVTMNGSAQEGPPAYAYPDFPGAGNVYAPALTGLVLENTEEGTLLVSLPPSQGRAWLIQLATGADPMGLTAVEFSGEVRRVWLQDLPTDLTLVAKDPAGDEIVLWQQQGLVPAGTAVPSIDFLAVAERQLAARFAESRGTPTDTLALPLILRSNSAGSVRITSALLTGSYEAQGVPQPTNLSLGGTWASWKLNLPGGRRPSASSLKLRLRHLGRAVNGYESYPTGLPGSGARVSGERQIARRLELQPQTGSPAGSSVSVVAVRVCLGADVDSEAVLSLHGDTGRCPGALLAPPVVVPVLAKTRQWVEFSLAKAVTLPSGQPGLWVMLRRTRGEIFWLADGPGDVRTSTDNGKTWAPLQAGLGDAQAPLVQVLHAEPAPQQAPTVLLRLGEKDLTDHFLGDLGSTAPGQWATDALALPGLLLDAIAKIPGPGRHDTELLLATRSIMELSIQAATFTYNQSATFNYEPDGSSQGG